MPKVFADMASGEPMGVSVQDREGQGDVVAQGANGDAVQFSLESTATGMNTEEEKEQVVVEQT
jgi:hypothetical protein